MEVELNQLQCFLEVAQRENISSAAVNLNITQPALSKTIARLEEDLNVRLFDRVGKTIRLNEYGNIVMKHAGKIFNVIDDMRRNIEDMNSGGTGKLSIGSTMPAKENDWLNNSIRVFAVNNPGISITQHQMSSAQITEAMEKMELDIAVGGPILASDEIAWTHIFSERMGIIMSRGHRFANRKELSMTELSKERFLCNSADFDINELTYQFCATARFKPDIHFDSSYSSIIGELVSYNKGISLIAENSCADYIGCSERDWKNDIVFCRLKDDYCFRDTGIAISRSRYLSTAARHLYDHIVQLQKKA